tara:strand:+ start:3946 stop:4080 length:135 start_codon:yes stop_codon:yes gene_type:complete
MITPQNLIEEEYQNIVSKKYYFYEAGLVSKIWTEKEETKEDFNK